MLMILNSLSTSMQSHPREHISLVHKCTMETAICHAKTLKVYHLFLQMQENVDAAENAAAFAAE